MQLFSSDLVLSIEQSLCWAGLSGGLISFPGLIGMVGNYVTGVGRWFGLGGRQ